MTGRRRLVVCDLDGTLLNSAGEVSARTLATLDRVRVAGWRILLGTGRPVRDTRAVATAIGTDLAVVCGNGSITYDFRAERIVDYRPMPEAVAHGLVRALRLAHPDLRLGAERGLDLFLEQGFGLASGLGEPATRVPSLTTVIAEPGLGKVIAQLPGDAREYAARMESTVSTLSTVSGRPVVTVSNKRFCEITAAGVTKGSAVRRLAQAHGFDREDVVAFGDMPNDLSVLSWAGTSVATANAHPAVLAAAHTVTASHDDDGVARTLDRLLREA